MEVLITTTDLILKNIFDAKQLSLNFSLDPFELSHPSPPIIGVFSHSLLKRLFVQL